MTTPPDLPLVHLVQPARALGPTPPPLVVLLHGLGADEHDLFALAPHLDPRAVYVSVRAPVRWPPGYAWWRSDETPAGRVPDLEQARAARATVRALLDAASRAYGTDRARTYLVGFSQGAMLAAAFALESPHEVAGVALLSGKLLPDALAHRAADADLRGLAVYAQHGTRDPVLPIADGRALRDALARTPVDLVWHEWPMAHEITRPSLDALSGWLRERLSAPR